MSSEAADKKPNGYDQSVFINCPFDPEYKKLLRPLIFTVVFAGYRPLLSSLTSDSGESRLQKICRLILSAKYSIHDLSRLKAEREGEIQRMNMPFELGIDYGTRQHGAGYHRAKRFLILEAEDHRYKVALSDLSGVDIKSHANDSGEIVRCVRDWFYETIGSTEISSPAEIWYSFNDEFNEWLFEERSRLHVPERQIVKDIEFMSVSEFADKCIQWRESRNR